MTATITVARDDVTSLVNEFFATNSAAADFRISGELKRVVWDDVEMFRARLAVADVFPWAHAMVRHSLEMPANLGNVNGKRRWKRTALLNIQCFFPSGKGLREHDPFIDALITSLRGRRTTNGVLIRSAKLLEVGTSGPWFMSNVVADLEYYEIS